MKLPVRQYKQIEELCSGKLVLTVHLDDMCLLLYPLVYWQEVEEKVSKLPSFNIHTKRLKRKMIGHALDCEVDNNQRILIPSALRAYVPNKRILISGQGNNLEIWDEVLWYEHLKALDESSAQVDIPEEILTLSI